MNSKVQLSNKRVGPKRQNRQLNIAKQVNHPEQAEMRPFCADLRRFGMTKPASVIVRLRWDFNKVVNNAGTLKGSISLNANGVFDIDPAFLSTAVAGFAEWHAFYQTNRVLRARMNAVATNLETQPIQVVYGWVPSAVAANAFAPVDYGNRWMKQTQLSAKGGQDRSPIKHTVALAECFGSDVYYGDLANFCGTVATNPVSLANFVFGIQPVTGVLTTGVSFTGFMEFEVEFFGTLLNTV